MKRSWLRPVCWLMGHEDGERTVTDGSVEVLSYTCRCCGRVRKTMRESSSAKFDVLLLGSPPERGVIFPRHPERFDTGDVVLNTRSGERVLVRVRRSDDGLIVVRGHHSSRAPMLMCDELLNIGQAEGVDRDELEAVGS